ncbi:MAG TPA: hypothetical protein VER10_13375 [Mycobacterium sp.]|jgi:hypothetical protein|nr:hypothetical protein [Mycobacterium sp.]
MPPDRRGGAPTPESARHHHRRQSPLSRDQHPQGIAAPRHLGYRDAPSLWLGPLRCGCPNSWPCDCGEAPPSDRWVNAGAAAASHLLDIGCTPLLPQKVLCALWRRGGGDRALAENLYELAAGE